jgi:hypothetical protein
MLSAVMAVMAAGPALAATRSGASTNTAGTTITTGLTAPIDTCTDGDITINSGGSVKISKANTAAVTINSANKVVNGNIISNSGATSAVGILLDGTNGGVPGYTIASGDFVSNTGTIDLTGSGTSKAGIEIENGTFTSTAGGGITLNAGASSIIKVNGDNSAGVLIASTGTLNGSLNLGDTITMTPSQASNNSASSGVSDVTIAGKMNGDVTILSGALLTATGENSQGIIVSGSINPNSSAGTLGTLTNQGTVSLVGIRLAAGKVGTKSTPESGSALLINGNISGGIVNSGPQIFGATTPTGQLTSSGFTFSTTSGTAVEAVVSIAPAVTAATGITIGKDTNDTNSGSASFINRGVIVAQPLSSNNTTAVFITGLSSTQQTTLSGSFFTSGTISAIASSTTNSAATTNNPAASAIVIGGFSTVPSLVISGESVGPGTTSGSVNAFVGGQGGGIANGIAIAADANLPVIDITNPALSQPAKLVVTATTNNPSTVSLLKAVGIFDLSNTLKTINNAGDITVTVTTLTPPGNTVITNFARAIDLSAQTTGGVTINDAGNITGDVLLNGTDNHTTPTQSVVNVGVGSATGASANQQTAASNAQTATGNTANSTLNPATLTGDVVFGDGVYALYVNDDGVVAGSITNNSGVLDVGVSRFGSLNVKNSTNTLLAHNFDVFGGGSSVTNITISVSESLRQAGVATITAQNEATIGSGANLGISIASMIPQGTHDYVLIHTQTPGTLKVPDFPTYATHVISTLPFFFDSSKSSLICASSCIASQDLILELTPKVPGAGTLADPGLGLKGNALAMYGPAVQALLQDNTLGAAVVNGIQNPSSHTTNTPEQVFSQFAPDVSGDIREIAITLTDQASGPVAARQRQLRMYANQGGDFTLWGQEFAEYFSDKANNKGELTHFKDHGFGFALGADGGDPADGWYGGAFTFYAGDATQTAPENSKNQTQWYMLTGYTDWRGHHLFLDTQASVGLGDFRGKRFLNLSDEPGPGLTTEIFSCGVEGKSCAREADSKRKGLLAALGATTGAIFNYGPLVLMPEIGLDALTMREEGYSESGGGTGFDLKVQPYYANSLRTFLGADSRVDVDLGDFTLQPEARLGYRFDFINDPVKVRGAFVSVPGDQFTITGPDPSRGNVVAGATLGASTDTWSMGVNFDWVRGSNGSTTEVGTFSLLGRI